MASRSVLLITGPPGIGKTTLIRKVAEQLKKSCNVVGFYTAEVREKGQRVGFQVVDLSDENRCATLATVDSSVRGPKVGKYTVAVNQFENIALQCFGQTGGKGTVLIIDEIGKMESYSTQFVAKLSEWIEKCENSACPLIATIPITKAATLPIVQCAKQYCTTPVITVDLLNRDELVDIIVKQLNMS